MGVGRPIADIAPEETAPIDVENSSHHPPGSYTRMSHLQIKNLLSHARVAQFGSSHTPHGLDTPTWEVRKSAAVSGALNLSTGNLSNLFDEDGRLVRTPQAAIAATTVKLSAAILKASHVAGAGANIIICPDNRRAVPTGRTGDVVFETVPKQFRTFSAAPFATVADDEEVTVSPYPALSADIDWEQSPTLGLRFNFTRVEQKEINSDLLAAEIIAAVTLSLARAADATMLAHIAAATPSAFTLAKAAAQGLRFGELAALVGTSGNGATVTEAGDLRAAGVLAELTPDMAGTLVGAWDRAAIAIHEDVPLHFERLNMQGHMAVTAWANLIPLVPDASKFWTVPA